MKLNMPPLPDRWRLAVFLILLVAGVLCSMDIVWAQAVIPNEIDLQDPGAQLHTMLGVIHDSSRTWTATLYGYAIRIFWSLAGIQFVWTFGFLIFRQADFAELISELVRFILITGFFLALLTFSKGWIGAIVDSLQELGFVTLERGRFGFGEVSAVGIRSRELHPGVVFAEGIELAYMISVKAGGLDNSQNISGQVTFYATLTMVSCFVFISGFMSLALLESWMVINLSVLFMGLGGSEWTRQYARQQLIWALTVGIKLFVMVLLVGLIMSFVEKWKVVIKNAEVIPEVQLWTLFGLSILSAFFVKTIPEMVQAMISGTASTGGTATSSAENTTNTVVGYPQRYGGSGAAGAESTTSRLDSLDTVTPRTSQVDTMKNGDFGLDQNVSSPRGNQSSPASTKNPSEVATLASINAKGIPGYDPPTPDTNILDSNSDNKGDPA